VGKALYNAMWTIPWTGHPRDDALGAGVPRPLFELLNLQQTQKKGTKLFPALAVFSFGPKAGTPHLTIPSQVLTSLVGPGAEGHKQLLRLLHQLVPTLAETLSAASLSSFLRGSPSSRHVVLVTPRGDGLSSRLLSLALASRASVGTIDPKHQPVLDAFEGALREPFPALYLSSEGPDTAEVAASGRTPDPLEWKWTRWTGEMRFQDMLAWLDEQLGPLPPVPFLTSQKSFDERCKATAGVCIIGVLPGAPGQSPRSEALATVLREAAARAYVSADQQSLGTASPRLQRMPVRFLAIEADAQPAFLDAFQVRDVVPALVALNPRSLRYAVHRGAFDAASIRDFTLSVVQGHAELDKIHALPPISKSRAAPRASSSPAAAAAAADGKPKKAKANKKAPKKSNDDNDDL
jgi:hypothetical protein